MLAVALVAAACSAPQNSVEQFDAVAQAASTTAGTEVAGQQLPINRRFASLDDYLAYLEKVQGPVDGSWYKQVSRGVYELQSGNFRPLGGDSRQKRRFTREELMKKFGFTR